MHSIVLCVQMSFAYWTLSLDNTSLKKTISVLVPRLYIYLYQLPPLVCMIFLSPLSHLRLVHGSSVNVLVVPSVSAFFVPYAYCSLHYTAIKLSHCL